MLSCLMNGMENAHENAPFSGPRSTSGQPHVIFEKTWTAWRQHQSHTAIAMEHIGKQVNHKQANQPLSNNQVG